MKVNLFMLKAPNMNEKSVKFHLYFTLKFMVACLREITINENQIYGITQQLEFNSIKEQRMIYTFLLCQYKIENEFIVLYYQCLDPFI